MESFGVTGDTRRATLEARTRSPASSSQPRGLAWWEPGGALGSGRALTTRGMGPGGQGSRGRGGETPPPRPRERVCTGVPCPQGGVLWVRPSGVPEPHGPRAPGPRDSCIRRPEVRIPSAPGTPASDPHCPRPRSVPGPPSSAPQVPMLLDAQRRAYRGAEGRARLPPQHAEHGGLSGGCQEVQLQ